MRTERLILRPVTGLDIEQVIEVHGDPEATRDRAAGPADAEQSAALLVGWVEHWRAHGFGYWAVDLAETGRTIGFGGLQHSEFGGERYLNLYYRFRPSAWGRGYAPEMGRAAQEWTARRMPSTPIWIVTNDDNTASHRVAGKLGFTHFATGDYSGTWCRFYRWRADAPGSTKSTSESNTSSA